jgi:hypothetical protein
MKEISEHERDFLITIHLLQAAIDINVFCCHLLCRTKFCVMYVTNESEANIVGVKSGVQAEILAMNRRAFFTECGCHNRNSLLGVAGKSSIMRIVIFCIIQRMAIFFSQILEKVDDFKPRTGNSCKVVL